MILEFLLLLVALFYFSLPFLWLPNPSPQDSTFPLASTTCLVSMFCPVRTYYASYTPWFVQRKGEFQKWYHKANANSPYSTPDHSPELLWHIFNPSFHPKWVKLRSDWEVGIRILILTSTTVGKLNELILNVNMLLFSSSMTFKKFCFTTNMNYLMIKFFI